MRFGVGLRVCCVLNEIHDLAKIEKYHELAILNSDFKFSTDQNCNLISHNYSSGKFAILDDYL
jgi:hypothetical protein